MPGDYFLQYIFLDGKKYTTGILFFGGMQLCLLIGLFSSFSLTGIECGLFLVLTVGALLLQRLQRWEMGEQRLILSVYTVLVILMAAKCLAVLLAAPAQATILLGLGGSCFLVSDLILGIDAYYSRKKRHIYWNRVSYFTAQLLLACSISVWLAS